MSSDISKIKKCTLPERPMPQPKLKAAAAEPVLMPDGWPATGLLRVDQIIGPGRLPISKSQFWKLVAQKKGVLTPVHLSPRVTCFWVRELRAAFFADHAPNTVVSEGQRSTAALNTKPHNSQELVAPSKSVSSSSS